MKVKLTGEIQLLSDISEAFAESLDLEATLKSILKLFDTHLKLRRGTITLLDPDTEMIHVRVAHGLSKQSKKVGSYKMGEGITGMVVQSGKGGDGMRKDGRHETSADDRQPPHRRTAGTGYF